MRFLTTVRSVKSVEEARAKEGDIAYITAYNDSEIRWEFFRSENEFRTSDLETLDLEAAVLVREKGGSPDRLEYLWSDLFDDGFEDKLSKHISKIENKITADVIGYDEQPIQNNTEEALNAIEDFFDSRGYTPTTELGTNVTELNKYGIDTETCDMAFIYQDDKENEKYVLSHGKIRDNKWYLIRFKNGNISEIEEEKYKILKRQLRKKSKSHKYIKNRLSETGPVMKGLTGVTAILSLSATATNIGPLRQIVDAVNVPNPWGSVLVLGFLAVQVLFVVAVVGVLFWPHIKIRSFNWDLE
jgi:hypothetical protein